MKLVVWLDDRGKTAGMVRGPGAFHASGADPAGGTFGYFKAA